MRKLGCLLMLALLWGGGQGVYEAVRYRQPQELTCEAAQAGPPRSAWLHITGCRVDMLEAAYKTRNGAPTGGIYVPLVPKDRKGVGPVRFVLATKDPDLVALVTEMAAVDKDGKNAGLLFLVKNAKRLMRDKDVTGMVQSGIDKDDKLHARLRELNKELVEDFVVLDEGRAPRPVLSFALLGGGAILLLLFFVGAAGKQRAG